MRKAWQRPKLVILVRNAVPESVLITCKAGDTSGPNNYNPGCFYGAEAIATCGVRGEMLGIGNALVCNVCNAQVQS